MVINFDSNIKLIIDDIVVNQLLEFKQHNKCNESGGILLGKKDIDDDTYYITNITTPTIFDKARMFSFVRSFKIAQVHINRFWKKSNGIVNYLGEWHTHNEKIPTPSSTDRRLLRQIYNDESNCFQYYFMLILGNEGEAFVGVADSSIGGSMKHKKIVLLEKGERNA